MSFRVHLNVVVVALLSCVAVAFASALGPEWIEAGDAGSETSTSQTTTGNGQLGKIKGGLVTSPEASGVDSEDMYLVRIVDPENFCVTQVVEEPTDTIDIKIFVFASDGRGCLGVGSGIGMQNAALCNTADDATGKVITDPGLYYIAVSGDVDPALAQPLAQPLEGIGGNDPQSRGGPIFSFVVEGEISGPDGIGQADPVTANWTLGGQIGGTYAIELTGVGFAQQLGTIPTVSEWGLIGLGTIVVVFGVYFVGRRA